MNIKLNEFNRLAYLKNYQKIHHVNTICQAANCPNRYECFAAKTATFLLLGNICTRNCHYCNVTSGIPGMVDESEIVKILQTIADLQLNYVVLTQVTRDDLIDGGAEYIVSVMEAIRRKNPHVKIEVLISDLNGNWEALAKILRAKPDVLNHNIEVVRNYFPKLRPQGNYDRSLMLLQKVNKVKKKSGLMVGFGEDMTDIKMTLQDLRAVGVDIITIGQYLPPSDKKAPVQKYYSEELFAEIKEMAYQMGFQYVAAGPLVRSSYRARDGYYHE